MGPPGIGKTAIMEQIASELGIGLLSYSMTHHTRQSALGLPLIKHTTYQGKEYDVSEYTMSEIIASVYDMMETSGIKNGILFLDEINCVSETLTPIMLQFLQYKVFGKRYGFPSRLQSCPNSSICNIKKSKYPRGYCDHPDNSAIINRKKFLPFQL